MGSLIPLQRCSQCILQSQPIGLYIYIYRERERERERERGREYGVGERRRVEMVTKIGMERLVA